LKKSEDNVADIVDTAYYYKGYGKFHTLRPRQVRHEIETLAEIVADIEPSIMLEIGTERGGTFYIWNRLLNESATIISIDLPEKTTDSIPYDRFLKTFTDDDGRIEFIRGNSQNIQTIDEVNNVLDGQKLDFLFIDTEFTYDNVQADFENYTPLVRDGGLVAIHDICHPDGSVDDFWDEIHSSDQYNTEEIVCSSKLRDYHLGIGVVYI
jgi:predicted O-methyltransferase YrrM